MNKLLLAFSSRGYNTCITPILVGESTLLTLGSKNFCQVMGSLPKRYRYGFVTAFQL